MEVFSMTCIFHQQFWPKGDGYSSIALIRRGKAVNGRFLKGIKFYLK